MASSSPQLRRFVRRTLVDATGATAPDQAQLTAAFRALCEGLHQRLQTLFGKAAVDALFERSSHVTSLEFPWLAAVVSRNGNVCAPDAVPALPPGTERLEEGLAAMLAHNIWLLSAFVGEDLVFALVQDAWGTRAPAGDRPGPKVTNE